jgi:GNAT superfamily N-acetyltransferase
MVGALLRSSSRKDPAEIVVEVMKAELADDARVQLVLVAFDHSEVSVETIHVLDGFRRAGIARSVMQRLVEVCDRERVKLYLEAVPIDAYASRIAPDDLRDFYASFGFEQTDDEGEAFMIRPASFEPCPVPRPSM